MLAEYATIVVCSAFLGATMKIADLLDEHNYKWFKHADLLFGFLWGFLGAILILQNILLATIWVSVLFCFIVRYRLDYLNHGIATAIWFIAMFYSNYSLWANLGPFVYFASLFTISGLIHDHFQYKAKKVKGLAKTFFIDFKMYWYLIAAIYSIFSANILPVLTIFPFEYVYDYFSLEPTILKKIGMNKMRFQSK